MSLSTGFTRRDQSQLLTLRHETPCQSNSYRNLKLILSDEVEIIIITLKRYNEQDLSVAVCKHNIQSWPLILVVPCAYDLATGCYVFTSPAPHTLRAVIGWGLHTTARRRMPRNVPSTAK